MKWMMVMLKKCKMIYPTNPAHAGQKGDIHREGEEGMHIGRLRWGICRDHVKTEGE